MLRYGSAWRRPGAKPPFDEALDAARAADVVVFVGGLTGDVEGEEMKVDYPGFAGGDRTDLRLPESQRKLLEALHATGKPIVLVLTGGSALAVDWAQQHVPAILMAWYPGQRGGDAVADILFGAVSPSGRLPVTFYKDTEKLPPFDDYSMKNRTYRYFEGAAALSVRARPVLREVRVLGFAAESCVSRERWNDQSKRVCEERRIASGSMKSCSCTCAREIRSNHARARSYEAWRAVELKPGESQRVAFRIAPAVDLQRYEPGVKRYVVDPGRYEVQVGASSADIRQAKAFEVRAIR